MLIDYAYFEKYRVTENLSFLGHTGDFYWFLEV